MEPEKVKKRPVKNPPMTDEQLATQADIKKKTTKMYSKANDWREVNDAELSKIIGISLTGLQNVADTQKHITLSDTEAVKDITMRYMQVCMEHSVIPSFVDVANAIGCTREAIYVFMKNHPDHETSKWFRHLRDVFSDVVAKCAMNGALAGIPTIFVLKSRFGWREDADDMPQKDVSKEHLDADTIVEKYQDLPDT